jgi:hypothetical protein
MTQRGRSESSAMPPFWPARRFFSLSVAVCGVVCLVIGMAPVAVAQNIAYHYHIDSVEPRCGQRGTTVEVTMRGYCLENPKEVVFYRPGIRAVDITTETAKNYQSTLTCRFEIAADCPLGEFPFRVRTARELSTVSTFHVTPFPVVDEDEKTANSNDTLATAMAVTPNVTVRGRVGNSPAGDVDLYKVPAVAGQRLSIEVDAVRNTDQRFGDTSFDVAMRILDEEGRELAANDDNPLHIQDPLLSVKLPRDGSVFVEVKRTVFMAADHPYCVHIGTNRRPLAAYPAGGPAGKPLTVRFIGDPLGDLDETVEVPETPGTFEHFSDGPSGLLLRSSPFPNVLEDTVAAETRIESLPAAANGILDAPGDTDSFRMKVKKGDRYRLRVFAAAIGTPLDAAIRIRPLDAEGKPGPVELQADDSTMADREVFGTTAYSASVLKDTLDPSVVWESKADGEYVLEISDTTGFGCPTGVYRIEIEQPPDAVYTLLASTAFYWQERVRATSLAVPQGGRWTVNVTLPQGQGSTFKGDLEIVAHGLPTGVRLVSPKIPAGQSIWPVQFVADATAPLAAALVTLEARPVDPAKKILSPSQQNLPFCSWFNGDAWRTVRLDKYVLAVTEPAPFSIDVEKPRAPIVRGGELSIPVKITRRDGFDEPVEFLCDWVPKGLSPQPKVTIESGQSEGELKLSAAVDAALGTQPLVVTATTTQGFEAGWYFGAGRVRVSTEMVDITTAEPFVELASEPESVRRGERKRFTWTVRQKSPFEGNASVKLVGLPKGVSVVEPLPVITKDSKDVAFEIEASDEALMGAVKGLACEVIVQAAGQEIHQRSGSGTLRIDPKL